MTPAWRTRADQRAHRPQAGGHRGPTAPNSVAGARSTTPKPGSGSAALRLRPAIATPGAQRITFSTAIKDLPAFPRPRAVGPSVGSASERVRSDSRPSRRRVSACRLAPFLRCRLVDPLICDGVDRIRPECQRGVSIPCRRSRWPGSCGRTPREQGARCGTRRSRVPRTCGRP